MSEPMPHRRGRTIGTVIIGTCVLLMAAHALTRDRDSRAFPLPAMKANISEAERTLHRGASVFAVDGTIVGTVSGISRDATGHVERIRIATAAPLGLGQRIVIVRHTLFAIDQRGVQLSLSVAEVDSLPRAMIEDRQAS